MMSDYGTRLAFLAEKWSGENQTNRIGGAAAECLQRFLTIWQAYLTTKSEVTSIESALLKLHFMILKDKPTYLVKTKKVSW